MYLYMYIVYENDIAITSPYVCSSLDATIQRYGITCSHRIILHQKTKDLKMVLSRDQSGRVSQQAEWSRKFALYTKM